MSADAYVANKPIRTGELTHMVANKYGGENGAANLGKYIVLTQVAASTGGANNIADLMVLGAWHSSGNEVEGFEVKVSRADWLNEVKNPNKCLPNKQYCHRWWLVIADQAMVKDGELPADWGMMAVVNGQLKVIKKAPKLEPVPLAVDFVASLLRTDARETVPLDVHRDQIKDAKRDLRVELEKKYEDLLHYVRWMNKFLGIKFKEGREFYDIADAWRGAFDGDSRTYSNEEFVGLIKAALSSNLRDIEYKLKWMRDYASEIVEKVDKFQRNDKDIKR